LDAWWIIGLFVGLGCGFKEKLNEQGLV